MIVLFLILLVTIYLLKTTFSELFKVVAYNSDSNTIPQYDIETPYEQLISILQKNLTSIRFNPHPNFILQNSKDYIKTFTKYPEISEFPFSSQFKNILTDQFINQLNISPDFKNSKFQIFTNPSNIYYKNFLDTREYIFNVILHNEKLAFTTKLLVYITIDNLKSFMIDENIITMPTTSNIYINHIDIESFQETSQLTPFSNNIESYYLMNTNKLYLFKPFLTNEIYHNKTKL